MSNIRGDIDVLNGLDEIAKRQDWESETIKTLCEHIEIIYWRALIVEQHSIVNNEMRLDNKSLNDKFNFEIKYEIPAKLEETKPSVKIKVESRKFDYIKS